MTSSVSFSGRMLGRDAVCFNCGFFRSIDKINIWTFNVGREKRGVVNCYH